MQAMLNEAHRKTELPPGTVAVNLDDAPAVPHGIAFSAAGNRSVLVPDPVFINREGYRLVREYWAKEAMPWQRRIPVVFWRGGTSGRRPDGEWRKLPRIELCRIARAHPKLFDVAISHISQIPPEAEQELRDSGLMRPFIPDWSFHCYKYHIDIDGNTNAWSSFFLKLMTGSPVLKVASPYGFRQWYYDRLEPWKHFVPVKPDLSDLAEQAEWLFKHPEEALHIGQAAKALTEAMTYEAEMAVSAHALCEALDAAQRVKPTPIAASVMQKLHGADIYKSYSPEFPEDLQGWNSQHPRLAQIVTSERLQVIFDVGVWKGGSTVFLADLLKKAKIDGVVLGVDTFLGSPEHWLPDTPHHNLMPQEYGAPLLYRQFLSNVMHRGMAGYIVPLPQTSINAAMILNRLKIQADLIHIDAAHEYEAVIQDARAYWPLLRPGGYLVGDDYHKSWPGVIRGADEFAKEVGVQLEIAVPKWIARKPSG